MKTNRVAAVILAGGIGSRMKTDKTKQNIVIRGKTGLERTLKAFCESDLITNIVLVVREEERHDIMSAVMRFPNKPISVVVGGSIRSHSARNGFNAAKSNSDFVAIHDCARCLITAEMIDKVVMSAFEHGAATAACTVVDTVKLVNSDGMIEGTLPREKVYRAQTPQVFAVDLYQRALDNVGNDIHTVTDDNMLVELIGAKIACVDLGQGNIKITTAEDLSFAEFILMNRGE